jgi:hypothetical protein
MLKNTFRRLNSWLGYWSLRSNYAIGKDIIYAIRERNWGAI